MWLSNFAATRPSQITFHANDGTETTAQQGIFGTGTLLAYALDDGFRHTTEGKADAIATEQALCALTAYARLLDGRTSLYDMTDALGAVAVGSGATLVVTRRRRGK